MTVEKKKNVLLIGSGGVGTMAAYALETGGGCTVTAVLRSNYEAVSQQGFTIDSVDHGSVSGWKPSHVVRSVPDVATTGQTPYDYVVVTTKNVPDVAPTVVDIVRPAVTPGHSVVVLIQNGLNIEQPLVKAFPQNVVLSGVSLIGATERSHGSILHDDPDRLGVGAFENPNLPVAVQEAAARAFADLYGASGSVQVTLHPDFHTVQFYRWRKLVYNACYNPICAITGLDTGRMRIAAFPVNDLLLPAMREVVATAAAAGHTIPNDVIPAQIESEKVDNFFKPSMQQDVEKGNFTEFENLVGEPVREAARLGVPTPTLNLIYHMMRALQWRTKERKGLVELKRTEFPAYD